MASQEEDNKLECISNVNKEQERYYLNVYKKYDSILNDKSEKFEKKVTSLIEVWSSISELNLSQFDIKYVIQIIDWAKLHALNIVLTGEWRSTKESFRTSLLESIEKAQTSLAAVNDAFSSRCQKLADVVKKPWEDPVLANLIQEKDVEIGSKEIEFFCVETAYLVSVRLKKLCENHCEDLALNLVTNFLNYKKLATVQNFNLNATETQLWFIFDIYIALLYKFQDKAKILEQFEDLQLEEGVMLIKRFAKKRVKISKIWRNCHKISIFGSRFFMSRALMKYTDDYKEFVTDLLKTYLTISNTDTLLQEFVLSVRNITNLADAAGLCLMCEVIHREAADKLRVFAIEMYIRALTTDMNELERLKHVNEEDKVKSTTSRLAKTFTNLADLLDDHVKVARECVLTAFSLEPTKERLKRIEELAKRSGFPVLDTGQEWKCRLHPPVLPSDDLAWVCPECGEWMSKPELTAPLQMNMALHEALQESVLGISEALCDDLVVCLSNPRYQILSWLLAWGDLYRLCILYLNDPEKTKNFVTELKFVDVDYSMFEHIKREPVDEFTGIEKGYEQYLDLDFVSDEETSSVSEDSMSHDRSVGLGSDGAGEPYLPLPQPKSDPNTLKSLRMFRPNLKRKKDDTELHTPDKKAVLQVDSCSASSSGSSLESYLSSPQYNLHSDYSVNIPVISKDSPSIVYLPQAAGVTNQSITSNLSQVSAASNFSSFGYSSTYAAKPFEIPKQPVNHSDQVNSRIPFFNSTVNPRCYPAKLTEAKKSLNLSLPASTILQPVNSVFNTTNLSSVTSTGYVSNIIKSTLSYGVPKVTVTGSTFATVIPSETLTNSQSFGSINVNKQGSFVTPKQVPFTTPKQLSSNFTFQKSTAHKNSFVTPSLASQKNTSQQGSFATPNPISQKNNSQPATFTSRSLTSQKNASQQVANNLVPDLEALLKEVVNEIDSNKYETDSKNGVAATLLQLGGQVAKNQKQSIQVPQQPNLNQTPMKLPQEMSSPNGIKEECKTTPKNNTKPDKPNLPGEMSDEMMEPPYKQLKSTQENNNLDKIISYGKTMFKIIDLTVKIPKLNLENYVKQDIQKVLPLIQDSSKINPSNHRVLPTPPKSPPERTVQSKTQFQPEMCPPQDTKTLMPLAQLKTLPFLKLEHSTLHQDKSPSQTEVPAVRVHHQTKTAVEPQSPILPCQKEQFSMPQEVLHQEATVHSTAPSLQVREPQLKIVLNREPRQVLRRLESVIIIPPVKARKIISQALLKQQQDNKPLLKEPVLDLHSASINLVKNQGCPKTTNILHSLPKAGAHPLKVESSQYTKKNQVKQKKFQTICTPADSLKITTPITTDCDKDKKVQRENQKTDIETTEVVEDVTFSAVEGINSSTADDVTSSTTEDKNDHSVSHDSLMKTDDQVSSVKDNSSTFTEENEKANETNVISEEWEVSSTQNISDSIMTDSDLASDKVRIENKTKDEKFENYPEEQQYNSNNKNDISSLVEELKETIDKPLKDNDNVINDIKMIEIVNKKLNCDIEEANVVQNDSETNKQTGCDSKKTIGRKKENLKNAANWKAKDQTVIVDINKPNNCNGNKMEDKEINISVDKQQNKMTDSKDKTENGKNIAINALKIVDADKMDFSFTSEIIESMENVKEITREAENTLNISSNQMQGIPLTEELEEAALHELNSEIQVGENVVMTEVIDIIDDNQERSYYVNDMEVIPTVNEIKENILQSIRNQEIIKEKTLDIKKSRSKDEVRIMLGKDEPFEYINYWHSYCETFKLPPKTSKSFAESSFKRSKLSSYKHTPLSTKPGKYNSASVLPLKRSETKEKGKSKTQEKYSLFTDGSETFEDIDKENLTESTDVNSSEELDSEENVISNKTKKNTSKKKQTRSISHCDHYWDFATKPFVIYYEKPPEPEKKVEKKVKKYSNRHKRKHNVPCFKVDQEKNTRKSNNSGGKKFETKELSVVLDRLPQRITRRSQKICTPDPITVLQQKIRKNIKDNANAPICVLYKKDTDKPVSPLLDFNVRNQDKKKRGKKQKTDFFRNTLKKGGYISKKKTSHRKGILKRKSNFSSRKSRKGKHVHFNLKPQVFIIYSEDEKDENDAKSLLKNVPGLNDFSEVRPTNTEHVVNVVQVSESRSSTAVNQNTQTSTQVTPHIQRIGLPKLTEQKPDRLQEEPSTSSSRTSSIETVKPSSSQPSSLNNMSGSQVKPGQKSSVTSRQAPSINILSQQILKQPGAIRNNRPNTNTSELLKPYSRPNPNDFNKPSKTATVIKVEPEENEEVQVSKSVNTNTKIVTSTSQACGAAATATSSAQGSTILQFICKSSSLPKFQQAFGKTVYQPNSSNDEAAEAAGTTTTENSNQTQATTVLETKKIASKTLPVNVQPITGNVIFRGQVPVGQTVSLIPPGSNTRQLFRITGSTHEQISLVKETVIQNKMSALLAAALQGKPKITEQNGELVEEYSATRITLCRPGTVPPNATRIVKPVQLQIPANVIRAPQPNLSSTTLEQLREFDMVYKQVKERSSNPAQPETTAQSSQESQQQRISFTYVNQVQKYTQLSPVVVVSSYSPLQQTVSPALSVTSQSGTGTCLTQVSTVAVPKLAVKTSKGKNIKSSAAKTSPTAVPTIPKPQQKPQEDEHTTQRIFDILAEYAEQLRNSPDLNNKPAPRRRSNPPTNPSLSTSGSSSSKKKKKKSCSSTTSNLVETDNEDLTMGSEDSSGGNIVQLSMTDEEQSQSASITPPETNLEPATSSTPTPRPLIVADTSNQPRNVIIADSSVGEALKMPNTALIMPGSYIMPVSVVKGGQQIAVVSGGSKILTTVPARSGQNMLLFQSFVNQNKKGGISAVKYSTIQPFSGISSQNVAGVSAQPPVVLPSNSVATVALGQPITLKKLDDSERGSNTELLLTISQPREPIKVEKSDIPQPDSSTSLSSDAIEVKIEEGSQSDSSSNEVFNNIQKTNSVATSVIASVVKKELEVHSEKTGAIDTSIVKVEEPSKQGERIGSVLVNASTSNGPMLSYTTPRYRKSSDNVESTTSATKEFNHNVGKAPPSATKIFKNNAVYYAIRTKKAVSKKIDSEMQKQAAIERELRLQKSLSEECEDLGVDEPSTSDLFPEADLLFDSNHSPSYDQSGQRIQVAEVKAKSSMNLFSDDENSGPMRNDLFDYVEYHPPEPGIDQMNGNNASNESASSCEDTTLLPQCATMSEVTLNSPISPEYTDNTSIVNKYKYKYTNRKKGEKVVRPHTESWSEVTEVTSTEDTVDMAKEEETPMAIKEETVIGESVAEIETEVDDKRSSEKELAHKCPVHGSTDNRSPRRNARKPCSCFNGSKSPTTSNAKRRVNSPKSHTPTPIPSKKPLLSKKR